MPTIINPDDLEYKKDAHAPIPFDLLTLTPRLFKTVGAKHFAFDMRKLEPGSFNFPYHFHRNAEELFMIFSGSMTLRTSKGLEIIKAGQIIFFEIGETSAHQCYNHDTVPCVYLDIRSTAGIDITEYPDSGKIHIIPYDETFENRSNVDYHKGEENVQQIWDELKKE